MLDSADDVPGIALADADRERTEETLTDAPRLVAPYPDIDMDPETLELAAEWDESDDDEPVRVENMKAHFRRVRARKAVAEALVKSRKTQLDVTAKIPNIAKLPVPKTGTNEPSAQARNPGKRKFGSADTEAAISVRITAFFSLYGISSARHSLETHPIPASGS